MLKLFNKTFISFLGLILFWHLIVILLTLPPYILPSPFKVMLTCYQEVYVLLQHSIPTIIETLVGLTFSVIFGSITAIIMIWCSPMERWILPLIILSQVIPTFAIAPLLVLWFGYGVVSKIFTIIFILFFPITTALYDGLKNTPLAWMDLAHTMQANKWRIFWKIRFPAALPNFASGLRIATAGAPIGAIVGEWVGASKGLGFLMLNSNARMQIDLMFAALFVIILFSLSLYFVINKLLDNVIFWQKYDKPYA